MLIELPPTDIGMKQMMVLETSTEIIENTCCSRNSLKMVIKSPSCFRFVTNMRWSCPGVSETSARAGIAFVTYNRIPSFCWVFLYFFQSRTLISGVIPAPFCSSNCGVSFCVLHVVFWPNFPWVCQDFLSQHTSLYFQSALVSSLSEWVCEWVFPWNAVAISTTSNRQMAEEKSLWLFSVPC